ncbi:peptidase S8/S53 domain-containing protein [Xylariaceae sp. FL1019]|nr:peptidase S8/S53 domain-containing protein [Xylariaceae sp. FL1019]
MYVVKMKDGFESDKHLSSHMVDTERVYTSTSFKGFAKTMDKETLTTLRNNPMVEYVKEDQYYYLNNLDKRGFVAQSRTNYGIARVSHRNKGSSDYVYDPSAGAGTCIYMIDTGINIHHPDFHGRAVWGFNAIDSDDNDGLGHGTYTAGIAGSTTYGVAKQATLIAVKVFDHNGATAGHAIIDGVDWVGSDAMTRNCPRGVVANLSLGGGFDPAFNDAVAALVNAGIFVAVSAGNDNTDAKDSSPGSEPSAPGSDIESTSHMGGSTISSGTSSSSPIVAGLGAYFLGLGSGASGLCGRIKNLATRNVLSGVPEGTANFLAFNGATWSPRWRDGMSE